MPASGIGSASDVGIGVVTRSVPSRELRRSHDPIAVRLDEHRGAVLVQRANVGEHLKSIHVRESEAGVWLQESRGHSYLRAISAGLISGKKKYVGTDSESEVKHQQNV